MRYSSHKEIGAGADHGTAGVCGANSAPGLFRLWFFVRGRAYRPKSRRLLAYAFLLGMLFTLPAAAVEFALLRGENVRVPTHY